MQPRSRAGCGRPSPILALFLLLLLCGTGAIGQHRFLVPPQPNTIVNTARHVAGPYYLLTPDQANARAAIWSPYRFHLNQVFDSTFFLNFDNKESEGADGIAFVFQSGMRPDSLPGYPIGWGAAYMGFAALSPDTNAGIRPSIGIEFDAHYNNEAYLSGLDSLVPSLGELDHIDIFANGIMRYGAINRSLIGGPVRASPTSIEIEDGLCHRVRIRWVPDNDGNATDTSRLMVYFDNMTTPRVVLQRNIRNDLGNNTWWGFTSATGAQHSRQYVTWLDVRDTTTCRDALLGTQLPIDSSGRVVYQWKDPDGGVFTGRTIAVTKAGRYTVTMSLDSFCTVSDTLYVTLSDTCCKGCSNFVSDYNYFKKYPLFSPKESKDGRCCYDFDESLFAPLSIVKFNCPPYGLRISQGSTVLAQYISDAPLTQGAYPKDAYDICIDREKFVNGKAVVITEFLNKKGELLCAKADTLNICASCCDSIVVIKEPAAAGGSCSGNIFFGLREGFKDCDIQQLKPPIGSVPDNRPGYSIGYSVSYCLEENETRTFKAFFINFQTGDTLCEKGITINCPGVGCCEAVQLQLKHHSNPILWHPCCYQFHLNINPCYRCKNVYAIREMNGPVLLSGPDVLNHLPPLGAPSLVLGYVCNNASGPVVRMLELVDSNNKVICSIPYELPGCNTIPPIGPAPANRHSPGTAETRGLQVIPNPAHTSATLLFYTEEQDIVTLRITDATGREVAGKRVQGSGGKMAEVLQTAAWKSGLYIVTLQTGQRTESCKLFILH